jgi:hypothetical protein
MFRSFLWSMNYISLIRSFQAVLCIPIRRLYVDCGGKALIAGMVWLSSLLTSDGLARNA